MNKRKKVFGPGALIGLIFFIVGVCQLVAGISIFVVGLKNQANSEKIVGMVSEVTSDDIWVEYRYMGRDYEDRLSFYSSLIQEGEAIDLYINPENPDVARSSTETSLGGGIFIFMGAIFTFMGGSFLFASGLKKSKYKQLQSTGRKLYAEVTGGRMCYNYTVNGRHPYKLECKYEDSFNGDTFLYSSDYMWDDPEYYTGQQVAVYVDQNDMGKYYVDLDSLQSKLETSGNVVHDFR